MNQITPIAAFENAKALKFSASLPKKASICINIRNLAAKFGMHYAIIHRLGPPQMRLVDATYSSIVRDINQTAFTLQDLLGETALRNLLTGNCPVEWHNLKQQSSHLSDPLLRLSIRHGVSMPFHNAFGNHAALTIFDSSIGKIDLNEFAALALPLINQVLSSAREKSASQTALSAREIGCLEWAAAGKTSLETGIILGLSPHTVNQYLTEATEKLKAVNRTHAVTKAIRLGLINISMA